jgi:general secretion pathway protein G
MRAARKAFTLVEILIVVVILGILAAIVVPQFTSATQDAQGGNILSQLETMNSQCELFNAKYNEYPPHAAGDNPWTTDITLANGQTLTGGLVGLGYLKASPKNPHNNSSLIGTTDATDGWFWGHNTTTGQGQWFATNMNNDRDDQTRDTDGVFGQVTPGSHKLPTGWVEN